MPSQGGAFDSHGKLTYACENIQLTQLSRLPIGRCAACNQFMKLVKEFLCFFSGLALDALGHHRSRGLGNRAPGALERDIAYPSCFPGVIYIEIYSEVVA